MTLVIHLCMCSFHVGCSATDLTAFEIAIQQARTLFDLALERGQRMTILDIGGGFVGYCNEDVSLVRVCVMNNFREFLCYQFSNTTDWRCSKQRH
jgi:diaminopimelate decarboxylase